MQHILFQGLKFFFVYVLTARANKAVIIFIFTTLHAVPFDKRLFFNTKKSKNQEENERGTESSSLKKFK
jgi:hypothetical protein